MKEKEANKNKETGGSERKYDGDGVEGTQFQEAARGTQKPEVLTYVLERVVAARPVRARGNGCVAKCTNALHAKICK